nr:hypothetical protein Iba_scaffold30030CG0060 [Ipomoea batatas]
MCDENNDCDDIHVPIHFDNANIDCVDNGVKKVVDRSSENNCIIEDVDNEINFLNPYDFNDSDSFDSSNDDDENCVDTCENNSFVPLDDNDVLESFTFDNESLSNELANELHDMLCNVDEELNVDDSLLDLNDVEFDTFHDNCLDDAIYIHDLLGEEKEEKDGDLRDLLLSSEKEEEKESVIIEKENEEQNFENKDVMIEEVHCKIIEEEKEKTRNESVREEVEEKVRNDEKEFGEKKENEKRGKLEDNSILMDMDSCLLWEESMLCIELKEFVNARHLRAYREERVDGAKGLVPVQVCWNEGLKVASGYGR